jgi:hypothetical protein
MSNWIDDQLALERRKRMARWIVRQQLRLRHDDTSAEEAALIAEQLAPFVERYGPFNPTWMDREADRQSSQVDDEMAQQRSYRTLDANWCGDGLSPSRLAVIAAAVRAASSQSTPRDGEG